ncbi:MAG TPA: ATP-binding protein [Mucilaginibacter sp.]|nr:ATP-binding protein [Mucilaginibacter sp.]
MTTSAKIRLLLALLFASLLLTAIIVQKTYTSKNNLNQTAQTLEDNLHKKEAVVNKVINDKASFEKLKTLNKNELEALKTIKTFTTDENIWALTYNDGRLSFWSGVKVIPSHPKSIREGYSFIKETNGYYEVIKKSEGKFSAIFFIPVKINYPFQNQYLRNTFAKNLLDDTNIEIADFTDKNVYEIHSTDQSYLFSVKIIENQVSHKFFYFEAGVWALCVMVLLLLIHSICNYIANKGYVYLSFIMLGAFICLVRFINLQYGWPDFTYKPAIFNPQLYGSGSIYPTLGDLCINILCICWFVAYVYRHRDKLSKHIYNKIAGYVIVTGCILVLLVSSTSLLKLFYGLVVQSEISFDVNNVLNLSGFSVLGVLMLCFSFFIFYLLTEISLTVCNKLSVPVSHQVALLLAGTIIATIISIYYLDGFTLFYILGAAWVLIRGYAYRYDHGKLNTGSLVIIVLLCAIASSIKLNNFQSAKEMGIRRGLIQELAKSDDATADLLFKKIEKQIATDPFIKKYFTDTVHNIDYLKNYFQKNYFDGYLGKYEFSVHDFDSNDEPLSGPKNYELSVFKEMVMFNSYFKVSDSYFYRDNESFGVQNYFAMLPVFKDDNKLGTLVFELKSKSIEGENSFPELLIDGKNKSGDDFKDYSYAFYMDGNLISQKGKYVYSLVNNEFKGKVKDYMVKTTRSNEPSRYGVSARYSHLTYKPGKRNLIVVSKEEDILINTITSITFFFIVFLIFSVIIIIVRWLWARIRILYIKDNYLHWVLRLNFDKILYKTRIQFSIVLAVVITLVLVGIITYVSIVGQYNEQQDKMISDKISRIARAFENSGFYSTGNRINESQQIKFDEFANTYAADLTLFNIDGVELTSTQPKIYDDGLLAKRINAKAFIYLNKLQKSEFINDEKIGALSYKAAYVPVKDSKGTTLGYLQLPYFSNEADYKERVGSLLNAMINIYALIFIAIGLLAIIIARQITNPLNIIQYSLSKTIYGQKNEPIKWERNDEIGALIKEYNNMIAALEHSAQRLAQSERESAWREMAKQVAHEIKNPLTPLKLGLQLLEKSWRDKDPKFDQKFERFSKSFVEQIESLSSIASEFSAFAKMPDTRIEQIDLFEMLTQAVTIFKQMDNIKILFDPPANPFLINADRDQLLRCFNNLLKNAIEATPPERFGLIEINYLITTKNILLSIKDNGNGIPENLREKIFEPNFTTKSSGTGLGLAFVKNSIENAGGKVWFETIIGTGTTFYFSLPEAS